MELKAEKRVVNEVLENVKVNGDKALIEYTAKFDGVLYDCAEEMMIKREDIEEAYQSVESRYISVIRKAREMIWKFHNRQLENSWVTHDDHGVVLGQRVLPIERVGVYVPGGRAAYPSSVLMNVIPAQVAGVSDIIWSALPMRTVKLTRIRWLPHVRSNA